MKSSIFSFKPISIFIIGSLLVGNIYQFSNSLSKWKVDATSQLQKAALYDCNDKVLDPIQFYKKQRYESQLSSTQCGDEYFFVNSTDLLKREKTHFGYALILYKLKRMAGGHHWPQLIFVLK